jgi:hypothetical protein
LVKVNIGMTVSKNTTLVAFIAVARSSDGTFMGALVVVVQGITEPETLEAMACRESLSVASDHLLLKIRVASNCLNYIRSIGGDERGAYGHIV